MQELFRKLSKCAEKVSKHFPIRVSCVPSPSNSRVQAIRWYVLLPAVGGAARLEAFHLLLSRRFDLRPGAEQALVEDAQRQRTDGRYHGDVLGAVCEGHAAGGVPSRAVRRPPAARHAPEVEVALVVVGSAEVLALLERLQARDAGGLSVETVPVPGTHQSARGTGTMAAGYQCGPVFSVTLGNSRFFVLQRAPFELTRTRTPHQASHSLAGICSL